MSILSRALTIIDAISKNDQGMRFSEIAALLGHPSPATVNKILKELLKEGVLEKTASGRYALGRKIYFWGRVMAEKNTPIQVIRAQMKQLHSELKASVNLFTCIDQNMFCLENFVDPESPSLWQAGSSLHIHIAILGAIFFIPSTKLHDHTFLQREINSHPYSLSLDQVERMIELTELTGIQDDLGIFYPGMYRFAIPIREKGQTVMTLGLGIMPVRLSNNGLYEKIIAALRKSKQEIEEHLI